MASIFITADQFPHGTSRYTLAMAKCLGNLKPDDNSPTNRTIVHALINLVQGRMLEYLADRICREYDIQDPVLRQRIVTVLLGIFSEEFFALFRTKVEFQPDLVVRIARRILRKEVHLDPSRPGSLFRQPSDRLYPAIFRKYFEYNNLGILLELVESDAEIQKIILGSLLKKRMKDAKLHRRILKILEEDKEGVAPNLFMGYLKDDDLSILVNKVKTGAWKAELKSIRERMAHLRGD